MPTLLAIGTTHPFNVAGIGLDLRIAAQIGVQLVSIIAGISAQNASQVLARVPIADNMLHAQFDALNDVRIDAIHIGALVDAPSVRTIARRLAQCGAIPVVCDPVIAATGGGRLADDATVDALRTSLFERCTLITPNLDEAELLLGRAIGNLVEMDAAAVALQHAGAHAVLLKGGHLETSGAVVTDVLAAGGTIRHFASPRVAGTLRGTGDLLASMIAARLGSGDSLTTAVETGRAFVRACLTERIEFAGMHTIR